MRKKEALSDCKFCFVHTKFKIPMGEGEMLTWNRIQESGLSEQG